MTEKGAPINEIIIDDDLTVNYTKSPLSPKLIERLFNTPTAIIEDSVIDDPFPPSRLRKLVDKLLFRRQKYPIIVYRKIYNDLWSLLPKLCWDCKVSPCLCHYFEKQLKDPSLCWECQIEPCICKHFIGK